MGRIRGSFPTEFKADAVVLVRQQRYTVVQACQALGIEETALRCLVLQYEGELLGQTPTGRAITAEQEWIQALEAHVKRLEMEKTI